MLSRKKTVQNPLAMLRYNVELPPRRTLEMCEGGRHFRSHARRYSTLSSQQNVCTETRLCVHDFFDSVAGGKTAASRTSDVVVIHNLFQTQPKFISGSSRRVGKKRSLTTLPLPTQVTLMTS